MQVMVTRTGDRNPRYARGKPHQEIQSEILTCGLQSSHAETDDQKIQMTIGIFGEPLLGYVEHEKHGNFASRKFARSPPDERARRSPSGETEPVRATHAVPFRRVNKNNLTRKCSS